MISTSCSASATCTSGSTLATLASGLARFRLPVLRDELAVPRLGPAHRHHERGVEDDQRRAGHEVDRDHAEPVVRVEVDVEVRLQHWTEVCSTQPVRYRTRGKLLTAVKDFSLRQS